MSVEEGRLVISRSRGESFIIGNATVKIIALGPGSVRLLVKAPKSVRVLRSELLEIDSNERTDGAAAAS